jgi:hypothetical protein
MGWVCDTDEGSHMVWSPVSSEGPGWFSREVFSCPLAAGLNPSLEAGAAAFPLIELFSVCHFEHDNPCGQGQ